MKSSSNYTNIERIFVMEMLDNNVLQLEHVLPDACTFTLHRHAIVRIAAIGRGKTSRDQRKTNAIS